ncbi:type II secretion system F family protein [Verrucomicrobiota bacterium]
MTLFIYKAKDGPGKTVRGELKAPTRSAALADIDRLGYSPVWVRERQEHERGSSALWRRVRYREVTVFTRQLASLIRSGVPILRGLSTIAAQTDNPRFRRVVEQMENTIREGGMLSGSLSDFPRLFPPIYVNVVRSGESAGRLDSSLTRLAEAREREEELRRKVQAAMAYPILILVVGIATVAVLLVFFLPRIIDLLQRYEQDLPLATRIVMGTSGFFAESWGWVVIMAALLVLVVRGLLALRKGRTVLDTLVLHLPFVRLFVLESDITRFARTLAMLTEAGVSADRALDLSGETLRNSVLREEIRRVRDTTVRRGMPISSGLGTSPYFPPFVTNMAAVGEEAGRLDEALHEIAAFYEKELEQRSRLATTLIEPVLILLVGLVVGFIVIAMLLPIFQLGPAAR